MSRARGGEVARGAPTGAHGPRLARGAPTGAHGPRLARGAPTGARGPRLARGAPTGDRGRSLTRGALIAALALLGAPATAPAATAPGRVVIPVATKVPSPGLEARGAVSALALPDGGIVAAADPGLTVVRLRADGSLDPSFGAAGIARPAVPGGVFTAIQLLRRPDGRLVVVGAGADDERSGVPRLLVAGLTADGALDPGFGGDGFVALDIEPDCGFGPCELAALAPDGGLVLTGAVGQISPAQRGDDAERAQWVVRRVSPAGTLDAGFGRVTIRGTASDATDGISVAARPTGQIVVLGEHDATAKLAGLTATGAPDRSFGGGKPVTVPSADVTDLLLHSSGAIDVVTATKIVRFTVTGAIERSYGKSGIVDLGKVDTGSNLGRLLDGPGEATTLWWVPLYAPGRAGSARAGLLTISPAGVVGAATRLEPAFGGGSASAPGETTGSVSQNSFAGDLLVRPDGSYVIAGGVLVSKLTPSLDGVSAGYLAVAAFTRQLAPDLPFGGPAQGPTASVSLEQPQLARAAVRKGAVRARVTASSPGLVGLRVTDAKGRILARGVEPVYAAGTTTARIALTKRGRRILRAARHVGVRVRYDFRDLLTGRAVGTSRAVLG